MVEQEVIRSRQSYLDSIVHLCEQLNLEIEDSKKYINDIIKDKLEAEARSLNFLPKGNKLPFD